MLIDTKSRSTATEIMDDFYMEGAVLQDALNKIASINQLLGGNLLTLQGVIELLNKNLTSDVITIVDVGCGNGDMLRELADFASKNDLNFNLIGIDANLFTINYAKKCSQEYSNIEYKCLDIFDEVFSSIKYDIVLCTLTLHHFKNNEIQKLLQMFYTNSKIGIVVNDLQRSKLSYYLFHFVCVVFRLNYMSKNDGLTSILRGFKRPELIAFSKNLDFKSYSIKWKWAFRWQWIIRKV